MTLAEIVERMGAKREGSGYAARCPAHEDRTPSLSLSEGRDGRTVLHCQAGCTPEAVVTAAGLTMADLFADASPRAGRGEPVAVYDYTDETGGLLYQVCRFLPKDFRQRRPDGPDRWTWNLKGVRRVLYRLPAVLAQATAGRTVLIVEGEKDVHALEALGFVATTNAGGAGKWRDDYGDALRGAPVVILPDNDDPGRAHAEQVARSLQGVAKAVRIVALPDLPPKGDVSDWIAAGGTADQLKQLVNAAPVWTPAAVTLAAASAPAEHVESADAEGAAEGQPWPSMAAEAFVGPVGDYLDLVGPTTEADPVAILGQFLTFFGNAAGRLPHVRVEANRHPLNEFVVIVGNTAGGRKGTALGRALQPFRDLDPTWASACIKHGGISSSEGLLEAIRDGDGEHPGVTDKRLMLVEQEWSQVLRVARREGNTVSPLLRNAWDAYPELRTLTRHSPLKVTNPHISLIGHITSGELLRELTGNDATNGLGNRHLFLCARRSKLLPDGGDEMPAGAYAAVREDVRQALEFAHILTDPIRRDPEAAALWREVYGDLTEGEPGLVGAMTSRAEAHTVRLAAIYAVLRRQRTVTVDSLRAGLAVWAYALQSVRYLFGHLAEDADTRTVLAALQAAPGRKLTRTEVNRLFAGKRSSQQIDDLLRRLKKHGVTAEKVPTRGAPILEVRLVPLNQLISPPARPFANVLTYED